MTGVDNPIDIRPSAGYRVALVAAMVGLIPGFGYLTLFLLGLLGLVDWVSLLSDRLTAWFAPVAIGGLILSIVAGISNGATSDRSSGLRACISLAVVLLVVDVPLMFVQLVCLFAYYD